MQNDYNQPDKAASPQLGPETDGSAHSVPPAQYPSNPINGSPESIQPSVKWEDLQAQFACSNEFVSIARSVFHQHGEVLRRLA
jgi:hypothetical protein